MKSGNYEITHLPTHKTHVLIAKHAILCESVHSPLPYAYPFFKSWGAEYNQRHVVCAIFNLDGIFCIWIQITLKFV